MAGPLLEPFLARAALEPERIALRGPARSVTCGALASAARAECERLQSAGLVPGDLLALCAPPGPGFLVAWLAARLAGACVALVDHAGQAEARSPEARARRWQALRAGWSWEPGEAWPGAPLPAALPVAAPSSVPPASLADAAVVKLTSGSTGVPRGVLVSERALAADGRHLIESIGLAADDRALCLLPLSHSYGFSVLVAPFFLIGFELLFPAREEPLVFARQAGATFLPTVPAWLRAMLPLNREDAWPATLRLLLSAGEPLPPALARELRARTGRGVHVLYGASEVGAITYDRRGDAAERGTVGTPVAGVEVFLREVDAEGSGRVAVQSDAAGSGPWPPEASLSLSQGTFLAADRGSWSDGELRLGARLDDLVNVRGKKVDPRSVERVLLAIDGVEEAVVLGVPRADGSCEVLRAVLVLAADAPRVVDVLRQAAARLAPHEVPRGIVQVEALPRTARGKLDHARLAELASGTCGGS